MIHPDNELKPWMKCFGALSHLSQETARINSVIEEEFEDIESEERVESPGTRTDEDLTTLHR